MEGNGKAETNFASHAVTSPVRHKQSAPHGLH